MPHTADIPVAVAHRIAQSNALPASPPETTKMTTPPHSYWKTLNVREIDISHIRLDAYGCCDVRHDLPDDRSVLEGKCSGGLSRSIPPEGTRLHCDSIWSDDGMQKTLSALQTHLLPDS